MPEIYSMARWATPSNRGWNDSMQGDKYAHSIKHRKKRGHKKGCPNNNGKEHFYVATKVITVTYDDRIYGHYSEKCLLCEHRSPRHYYGGKIPKTEVAETVVYFFGYGQILVQTKRFEGDTDERGTPRNP